MMNIFMTRLKDQTGVAMVTVLLIGAVLTVLSSTAAFVTIEEFRAGGNDRRALAALSYAEAGVDRFISHIKSGLVTYKDLNVAGCSKPAITLATGTVGAGEYRASLTVYDPHAAAPADRFPIPPSGGACATRPDSPNQAGTNDQTFFVITSIGRHPAATRTVRQVIALELINLPVGIYAHSINMQSAKHPFYSVSMVSETEITHRGSISFIGDDPFYRVEDFFSNATGRALTAPVPAAAHAAVQNFLFQSRRPEFADDTKQCNGNGSEGTSNPAQSLWDSDGSAGSGTITSGCTGWASGNEWPHSSKFTEENLKQLAQPTISEQDHQTLAQAARRYGVYCTFPGSGGSGGSKCYQQDVDQGTGTAFGTYIENVVASGRRNFIAYLDYRSGAPSNNNMSDRFTVWGCNDNPDLSKSVVVIIRNGGINWTGAGGNKINGALIMDGDFTAVGGSTINGTVIVRGRLNINSSAQHFTLDECWVDNMPGPFFRTVPVQWAEVDR